MFLGLFILLVALWLIFWLGVHITSGLIHLLLIVAIIYLVLHLVRGPRTTAT
jgi:hypothetical protein